MLATERILAIDIGAATVKLGEFVPSHSHGLQLVNFHYADIGIDPAHDEKRNELVTATLQNMARERRFHAKHAILSVPGQSVFIRFVKLPPVEEAKVAQIIQYEAQQNVPFPIDEVVWDHQLIGRAETGELEVVLVAIKSNIIEDIAASIKAGGFEPKVVEVAPMALHNAVRYNYGEETGNTLVLDIGARTTNLLFLSGRRMFSRSIPIAGNAITQAIASEFNVSFVEAEKLKKQHGHVALGGAYAEPDNKIAAQIGKIVRNTMTRLHAEVVRSVNFYRSQQGGAAPERVWLSGGCSILPYLDRFFQEKLSLPVEYFNPFRNVEIGAGVSREELSKCAHFYGEVVGAALRDVAACPIEVNLAPRSVQRRLEMEKRRPYLVGAAVGLLLIPIFWWAYAARLSAITNNQLQEVKAQVEQLRGYANNIAREKEALVELETKANQIANALLGRTEWLHMMAEINRNIVPDLWLTAFKPVVPQPQLSTIRTPGRLPAGRGFVPTVQEPTPAAPKKEEITEIELEGAGVHSEANPQRGRELVDEFVRNLRHSPYFDPNGVQVKREPSLSVTGPNFTFTILIKLSQPIPLP
jgi:type IV pilus assembly protein PilM